MVEVLGTLAIMGILGLAGMWAYNAGMDSLRASTLMNEAQKRAVVVAGQINMLNRTDPSLAEFNENTFGGGIFGTNVTVNGLYQQFGIQVSNVPKRVCQNILNAVGDGTAIRRLSTSDDPRTPLNNCTDENTFLMIYNNDLSTSSGDTKYCQDDSACQTVCGTCNLTTHMCENECADVEPSACTLDEHCQQAGICAGCNQQTHMCQACERVAYLESTGTQYIDLGLTGNENSKVEIRAKATGTPCFGYRLFGARTTSQKNGFFISTNSKSLIYCDFGTRAVDSDLDITQEHLYILEKANFSVDGAQIASFTTVSSFTTPKNLLLFGGAQSSGTDVHKSWKIKMCKYWEGSELLRDFVPVLDPQGVPAMYDKVNHQFYYNIGTGDFKTNLSN